MASAADKMNLKIIFLILVKWSHVAGEYHKDALQDHS